MQMQEWNMTILWIMLSIILVIVEGATVGLVVIWFAVGTVAAALASTVTNNIAIQMVVFLVVSTISLAVTKPLVKKWKSKHIPTNADRLIGTRGIITETVNPMENKGQMKVSGQIWSCKSLTGEKIAESEIVEIVKIEGVKLVVKKA